MPALRINLATPNTLPFTPSSASISSHSFGTASARGDGHGLPRFVEQEFHTFLTCGVLTHGFTRLRRADCAFERLLPFSCKRRGFCPSCGGRRMAERAAALFDEVLPPDRAPPQAHRQGRPQLFGTVG